MMSSPAFSSPLADVIIPETPLTGFVLRKAVQLADRPALIDGPSGRVITYAGLSDAIHRLAGGLQAMGFGPGSTLALLAPNCPEYAMVFHACAVAGGTVTTVNPTYGANEVRFQIMDAQASLVITIPAFIDTARAAMTGTAAAELIVIGGADGVRSLDQLMGEPIDQVPVDVHEAIVVLPYSSGTTGMPKGVMLSHYNLVANILQTNAAIEYQPGDAALAFLPFFHIYGMQVLMNCLLAQGVTVVTMPRFDLEQALSLVQQHRIAHFYAVPPVVLALAKHPLVDRYDLSSLRSVFSGAAPLGGDVAAAAAARIGCPVVQGYGMTELSPVSHITVLGQFKPGSSGVTAPNTQTRIVDQQGNDCPVDQEGEVWIKGPQVMKGYLNNPEATAATIDANGWLHTGDIGRIDADGHLTVVDRLKELIKVKGFQVPPAELEALILTHPKVADVAVIGIPDEESGEIPKAFVVLRAGESASAEDIRQFVQGHVATYKQIRLVSFVDAIPKSASGKILRRELRAAVASAAGQAGS